MPGGWADSKETVVKPSRHLLTWLRIWSNRDILGPEMQPKRAAVATVLKCTLVRRTKAFAGSEGWSFSRTHCKLVAPGLGRDCCATRLPSY